MERATDIGTDDATDAMNELAMVLASSAQRGEELKKVQSQAEVSVQFKSRIETNIAILRPNTFYTLPWFKSPVVWMQFESVDAPKLIESVSASMKRVDMHIPGRIRNIQCDRTISIDKKNEKVQSSQPFLDIGDDIEEYEENENIGIFCKLESGACAVFDSEGKFQRFMFKRDAEFVFADMSWEGSVAFGCDKDGICAAHTHGESYESEHTVSGIDCAFYFRRHFVGD